MDLPGNWTKVKTREVELKTFRGRRKLAGHLQDQGRQSDVRKFRKDSRVPNLMRHC